MDTNQARLRCDTLPNQPNSTGLPDVRNILGVEVSVLSKSGALAYISQLITDFKHTKILFLNAHGANLAWRDEAYRHCLKKFLVLPDGLGVDLCSLLNYGEKFPDNLNGTDFIPHLLGQLEKGVSVALLGAHPGVAELAAKSLQSQFGKHRFTVISHGYYPPDQEKEILRRLSELKPDILLVAFGNPAQEKWINNNCGPENCRLVFGVGALFDFIAGRIPRAPNYVRRMRLEWLYRLWLEPKRMWVRYIIGIPTFMIRALKQKIMHR